MTETKVPENKLIIISDDEINESTTECSDISTDHQYHIITEKDKHINEKISSISSISTENSYSQNISSDDLSSQEHNYIKTENDEKINTYSFIDDKSNLLSQNSIQDNTTTTNMIPNELSQSENYTTNPIKTKNEKDNIIHDTDNQPVQKTVQELNQESKDTTKSKSDIPNDNSINSEKIINKKLSNNNKENIENKSDYLKDNENITTINSKTLSSIMVKKSKIKNTHITPRKKTSNKSSIIKFSPNTKKEQTKNSISKEINNTVQSINNIHKKEDHYYDNDIDDSSPFKDKEKAYKFYVDSAFNGDVNCQKAAAQCCMLGIGTDKNYRKACQFLKAAAHQKDVESMVSLAEGYGNGLFPLQEEYSDEDDYPGI